jgi:hypothetical protein
MTAIQQLIKIIKQKRKQSDISNTMLRFAQVEAEKLLEVEKEQIGYTEQDLQYAFEQGKLCSNICYRRDFKNVLEIIKFKKL